MALRHTILCLMMMVLCALIVAADRLEFGDVEVDVDGENNDNLDDGDRIGDEAKPGDEIEIEIEISSNFTSSDEDSDGDEIEIQDIEVTVTFEGIDDGDDLEEDIEIDDLGAGDDDTAKVSFTIPQEVGEGDYDIVIDVEGEDTNGTTHRLQMTLTLEVEKERHELRISRASLNPAMVSCGRASQLSVTVLNTGQEDEEDNTISITSQELGLDVDDTFSVDEGEFDEDMEYSRAFTIPGDKDLDTGVYPINVQVTYDDGGEQVDETVELTVVPCGSVPSSNKDEDTDSDNGTGSGTTSGSGSTGSGATGGSTTTDGTTVVVAQPSGSNGGVFVPSTSTEEPKRLFDNPAFMVGILVIEIIIVIVGIAFVAYLMRKG